MLFPTSPDLRLYLDAPRSGWGTHLLDQVSTWTMVETGYLTTRQRPGVESLLLAPQTFQYMVTVHRVTAMYDTSAVRADVNKQGSVFDSFGWLTGQTLRGMETHNALLRAGYLPGQSSVLSDLLRQPRFNRFHGGAHALSPHAWRLSSTSSESQDFRDKRRTSCPAASREPAACLYQSQGLSLYGWCCGRGVTPVNTTINLIVDSLICLHQD